MAKQKEKEKKKGSGAAFIVIIAVIALLLLAFWKNGFGLGLGFGDSGGVSLSKDSASNGEGSDGTTSATQTSAADEELGTGAAAYIGGLDGDGNINIVVSGERVMIGENEFEGKDAIKDYLLSVNDENVRYVLHDDKALKSAYDEAKEALDELGYKYSEKIIDDTVSGDGFETETVTDNGQN